MPNARKQISNAIRIAYNMNIIRCAIGKMRLAVVAKLWLRADRQRNVAMAAMDMGHTYFMPRNTGEVVEVFWHRL